MFPSIGTFRRVKGSLVADFPRERELKRQVAGATEIAGATSSRNHSDERQLFALSVAPRRLLMLGRSGSSRAMSANVGEIERRLRSLEQHLERAGSRTSGRLLLRC
jgi:hypothetical protein